MSRNQISLLILLVTLTVTCDLFNLPSISLVALHSSSGKKKRKTRQEKLYKMNTHQMEAFWITDH